MSERQNANTVYIPITGKQLGLAITAIVTLVASYPVVNWFSPDARSDPFTGADGVALETAVGKLEDEHNKLRNEFIQFKAEQTVLMQECQRRLHLEFNK